MCHPYIESATSLSEEIYNDHGIVHFKKNMVDELS